MDKKSLRKHAYSFEDRNAFAFCYIIIGVPLLFFLFFWVYINFSSFLLGFQDVNGKFTFDNFKMVFSSFTAGNNRYNWNLGVILGRTVLLWFLVDVVCVIPSMLTSYVLYKNIWGASIFRVILMVPSILAGIVWVMVMKQMVGLQSSVGYDGMPQVAYGPVMTVLKDLNLLSTNVLEMGLLRHSDSAFTTIVMLNIFPHFISLNLIVAGAYARIPGDLFEVGELEGVNFIKEFFIVSVPLVWPTIVVSLITNLATIFTFDGNVWVYTAGEFETETIGFCLYKLTYDISGSSATMNPDYGFPAALGATITLITVPLVLFGKLFLEKLIEPVEY